MNNNSGFLFWPDRKFTQGETLDFSLLRPKRSSKEVREILAEAKNAGIKLSILGHLRGVDGCGSSLDLPEFQRRLTPIGITDWQKLPSTPTIASEFCVEVKFEKADNPEIIEYIAPDYGCSETNPYIVDNQVETTPEGKVIGGQLDAAAYIFRNLFGLKGIKITCGGISAVALAGGMESSNVFNIALLAGASILSGCNLSLAEIFSLAVKLECDEFSGNTGGQGHLCCMTGGAFRHVWLSGIKSADGKLINPYSAISIPLLNAKQLKLFEKNTLLVQAGKKYKNGKAELGRTASLINNIWTDLLRDKDPVGLELHNEKLGLTDKYTQFLTEGDYSRVVECVSRYVEIRDELCCRWVKLMLSAKNGQNVPEYAKKYAEKVFDKNNSWYSDNEPIRKILDQYGEKSDSMSLYSLEPIASLISDGKKHQIALMPLGAGGPGSNLFAISPNGREHLEKFLHANDLSEIIEDEARKIVRGSGILKGYIPFKSSVDPLKIEGFKQLGMDLPAFPEEVDLNGIVLNNIKNQN